MKGLSLVQNPYVPGENQVEFEIPQATLEIYSYIESSLRRTKDTNVNRASSATYCVKRRWYQNRGEVGEDLTPRKMVNFLLGDLSERVLLYFITQACVGPKKLYSEVDFGKELGAIHFQGKELKLYAQEPLSLEVDGIKISAHADGWGKRNSDGQWELIECKSAANWGYNDFKNVGPKEYLKQSTTLLQTDKAKALGAREVRFFYLRKETGHLWDQVYGADPELWKEVVREYKIALEPTEPTAPHPLIEELFRKKPTGRTVAAFPCTYCPFLAKCQGSYQIDWKSDQYGQMKPVFVFSGDGDEK